MKKVGLSIKMLFIICISLVGIGLICYFFNNIYFRETYLQSSSVVSLKTDIIEEINLNSGEIETNSFLPYNINLSEINLITNGEKIFQFVDNKWIEVLISGYEI
ncbi:MAG: hypothetical protein IKZ06_02925, partial [Oscillospiraceae bacterium]|nr:hypothetical protein [Oscillospiraceae bacterium]